MFHINIDKVNGRLVEKHITKQMLAKRLRLSIPTLRKYFVNPDMMPYGFVVKLAEIVCDSPEEIMDIFFVENLRDV